MKTNTITNVAIHMRSSLPEDTDDLIVKRSFQRLLHNISPHLALKPTDGFLSCVANRGPARAASLLAEPFGIQDLHLIEEATFASLCLDVFSHAIDDIADDSDSDKVLLAHLGSLLLAKAAQTYALLVAADKRFWTRWERYLEESSEAEICLRQNQNTLNSLNSNNCIMLGQKSALIKMSVALYASLTERWNLLEPLESGLMAAATGIQLIDDLIDWEEDTKSGIYTYPAVIAAQRFDKDAELHGTRNSGSVFLEVLDLARMKLDEGNMYFKGVGASRLVSFVDLLTGRIADAKKHFECLPNQTSGMFDNSSEKHLRWIIGPRLGH